MKTTSRTCLLLMMVGGIASARTLDLSGEWRFALDPSDLGIAAKPADWKFPDKIRLPGIVTAQGFGETPNFKTQWTGSGWRYPELFKEWQADDNFKFPFFLQPPKHYVGPAWYQREIMIPEDWQGAESVLHLERVHWLSTAWIDGKESGKGDSLGTPHEFNLGKLTPGKHALTLRIDNRLGTVDVGPHSHSVTDHTQGNWNGVVGKMELRKVSSSKIGSMQVYPSQDGTVKVVVTGTVDADAREAMLRVQVAPANHAGVSPFVKYEVMGMVTAGAFRIERTCKVENANLWNEFEPNLFTAKAVLSWDNSKPAAEKSTTFGFREVGTKDGRITINGRKTFLRGTLECCIFPLLGHPPTDVESWKRIVKICKAHGLNHIRFHSWCPPEAAFQAADELGFYYQVEVSSWAEIGSGRALDAWLEAESERMLDAYGNHPSFLLMAYGNEPAGGNHPKWLQEWVARRKAEDARRLYTTAAGWPLMAGSDFHNVPKPRLQGWGQGMGSIINGQPPRTDFDWSHFVKTHSDAPVVSHEIGQWCVYPNFKEIAKYTGYFKAKNFEIFQETARRNGLLDQSADFLKASGKLQALAYKHEIEAALRTPNFGGFQLLDLHDFPGQGTALVGVLDAFWDEKGYISPTEFSRFCGPVVPLARMKKMIYTTAENFEADLELAHFGPEDFKALQMDWQLNTADGRLLVKGRLPVHDYAAGELHRAGSIRLPLGSLAATGKLVLTVDAKGHPFENSWDIFVYPADPGTVAAKGVLVTADLEAAKAALAKGGRVLWNPPATQVRDDPARPLVAGFSPIFWNTAWTNWQPPHTLGILCNPKHPALAGFPTDFHSNWQWWELQQHARPFILTQYANVKPIVQVIDDWVTNRKLGYVFEAGVGGGKLLACSANLAGGPVGARLRDSLLVYMASGKFAPKVKFSGKDLDALINTKP